MVEQISNGIYKITVELPNSPLAVLNSYYIEGLDEDYLVDTGFNLPECRRDLEEGLKLIGADRSRISIINTHLHGDHTGQNYIFMSQGHHIYMSAEEFSSQQFLLEKGKQLRTERDKSEGAPDSFFDELSKRNTSLWIGKNMSAYTIPLNDGSIIHAKHQDIQLVVVPGHTAGNSMFWVEKDGIMFTGDNILFDITPNITYWPGREDILGEYINTLSACHKYPVDIPLPGHRNSGNYHKRIDELIQHHEDRMTEILNIIGNSEKRLNAFEITNRMEWKIHLNPDGSIPVKQMLFAAGEAIAHLDHLRKLGKIERLEACDNYYCKTYKLK